MSVVVFGYFHYDSDLLYKEPKVQVYQSWCVAPWTAQMKQHRCANLCYYFRCSAACFTTISVWDYC